MFVLDWHFCMHGSLSSTSFEEIARDVLHDEAYPGLGAPVGDFITRYLDAEETVLILLGQPGSGKTRLATRPCCDPADASPPCARAR
jgi:hypothetical protein